MDKVINSDNWELILVSLEPTGSTSALKKGFPQNL